MNRLIFRNLGQDVLSAYRALHAAPGFAAAVLIVLTLAMGATTAVFSVVDAVALRPLPFFESHRLVSLDQRVGGDVVTSPHAAPDFLLLRSEQNVFTGLAAVADTTLALRRDGSAEPEILSAQRVSADFFAVLRVAPARGRAFSAENESEGRDRVAVISHGLWQRRFGAAADILGRRLQAEDGDIEVVGVMPVGFNYPAGAVPATDLWIPYVVPTAERTARVASYLSLIARLKDDVTIETAETRINQIVASSSGEGPNRFRQPALRTLHESQTGYTHSWLRMLLAAVVCVLLIACANIANLTLVRATVRSRELGVRIALGATRWNLARMLLAESLLLASVGTALGILVAWWGIEILRWFLPPDLPRLGDIGIDARVLTASAAAALATGIGFGLAPVFQSAEVSGRLATGSSRTSTTSASRQWLWGGFLVAEVALAVVLLVGTALFLASFAKLMRIGVGLEYRDVVTIEVRPRGTSSTGLRLANVLDGISAIPGVENAALATANVPFSLSSTSAPLSVPGRPLPAGAPSSIAVSAVSPQYFEVLRIPLRRGRSFNVADGDTNAMVAILNETAAKTLFPGEDPIGQRIGAGFGPPRIIVGVVGDVRDAGPERDVGIQAFTPIIPARANRGTLLVKLTGDPAAILPQVKAAIWSVFPDLAIPAPRNLDTNFGALIATRRFTMILLSLFGLLGVTIAATGIYAVMSSVVVQRSREIAIRMALGAVSSAILASVLRRAGLQIGIGLVTGFGLAWAVARSVQTFLFRVEAHDLRVYAAVVFVLTTTALMAAFIPARRAASVDPLLALRAE